MADTDGLYVSLDGRQRPEDVAYCVLEVIGNELPRSDWTTIDRVAARAYRQRGGFSSMTADFERPASAGQQIASVERLFGVEAADDPRRWVAEVGQAIRWNPGHNDFKRDRLDRAQRRQADLGPISKRQYNKRFRALARLDGKLGRVDVESQKRRLLMIGRSGFTADITSERFAADPGAACFIAYWTARRNVRRMFSLSGRDNPFDEVCKVLYDRLGDDTDWEMVAMAYPVQRVLDHLDDEAKGRLLGSWVAVMREAAGLLRETWTPGMDRQSMVVRHGNDSSTWNTMATAFNAARASWLALLAATGATDLLDVMCPGKVMRLMAADLAWWHRSEDGDLDPDTYVWSTLPVPWEVVDGTTPCTRADIEKACDHVGIDPVEKGWTAPRVTGKVATFTPTPELVHGVAISDPVWASLLRRGGVFSGKRLRPDVLEGVTGDDIAEVVTSELPSHRPMRDV